MTAPIHRLAVIGAGAWGTALAQLLCRHEFGIALWTRRPELAGQIAAARENQIYLPGVVLDPGVAISADPQAVAAKADAALLAVPAQFLRAVAEIFAPYLGANVPVILCSKGIERDSLALMSEVVAAVMPGRPVAILSGPTFAAEVAR
ncbi:MAG: hypothetical protein FJX52_15070, partial [Alphaproteobacteria bacterium]|nr:hypothetical protein [Alphaproteobacteria bacterium]